MEAKIIFNNGEELIVEKNGNCYIVDSKPVFPKDLKKVTITSSDESQIILNAKLVECASIDNRFWFTFIEKSPDEIWKEEIEDALCDLSKE